MRIAALVAALLLAAPGAASAQVELAIQQLGNDISMSVSCALTSAIGTPVGSCPVPTLPALDCSAPTSVIGALQCLDADNSAQMTKLGTVLAKAMEAQETNRTAQENSALAAREGANFSVSPTRCVAAAAGSNIAAGEKSMQQQQLIMAGTQADRSQGVSGTATASGQAAAVAELAQAHGTVSSGSNNQGLALPDGSGTVTDLSAAALFADQIVPLPSATLSKLKKTKMTSAGELFIQHVFDPKPPPPQRNAKEPLDIQEARNARAARMDLAMAVPLDLAARQFGSYDDHLRSILPASIGANLTGKLSWNELMRYSIEGRYANAEWYQTVQGMSATDKRNEALYMQALELYLDYYQSRFEQKVGVVASALYAGSIDSLPGSASREIDPSLPSREP